MMHLALSSRSVTVSFPSSSCEVESHETVAFIGHMVQSNISVHSAPEETGWKP